ncbi:hypothetical protein BT69DRAFT_1279234 [Atractiella rhizophila]|nr:hypothetical protein BT69DRAFT_1279234 [Atractiella rhizophila]
MYNDFNGFPPFQGAPPFQHHQHQIPPPQPQQQQQQWFPPQQQHPFPHQHPHQVLQHQQHQQQQPFLHNVNVHPHPQFLQHQPPHPLSHPQHPQHQHWPSPPPPPPRTPPPPAAPIAFPLLTQAQQVPTSVIKVYKPYFSPLEVANLLGKLNLAAPGVTPVRLNDQFEKLRSSALGYIDRVGARLGFPRRTIGTAQYLYTRFHLFFSPKDFKYEHVAMAALLVSCKQEDTLKKTRDIQVAGHQLKSIVEGGKGTGEPDPVALENDRARLIGIERLILETIAFNFYAEFTSSGLFGGSGAIGRDVFGWVLKFGRLVGASKDYTRFAFLLAIDVYRTFVPLSYPPHAIAITCLWLARFLGRWEAQDEGIEWPTTEEEWEKRFEVEVVDVEEIAHQFLDLFLTLLSSSKSTISRISPSESSSNPASLSPIDPTNPLSLNYSHVLYFLSSSGLLPETDFTQIKIRLRKMAAERIPQKQKPMRDGDRWWTEENERLRERKKKKGAGDSGGDWLGRDDVTIRFKFRELPREVEEGEEEETSF